MPPQKLLIVIAGPTASGKTSTAIRLAQHYGSSIISADSRQFYREMNIGTAKPGEEELITIPHHFVNSLSITQEYSVGDYMRDTLQLLDRLFQEQQVVFMAGGSGLFIRAVCEGLDEFPEVPSQIRTDLEEEYQQHGLSYLQAQLADLDPDYYRKVDRNNPQRLIRALGVCRVSGKAYSSFTGGKKAERSFTPVYIALSVERALLYQRINQRVDTMMASGLLEEARGLYAQKHLNALQTVGYQELFSFLDETLSLEEAIELIKRNSRRYAKRQLTWLRKEDHWNRFAPTQGEEMIRLIDSHLTVEH